MSLSIMAIMNLIESDNVVLPAIQRGFVWEEEQIKSLLDSIMRGYPVGIALLWETYDDIQYREFIKSYWPDNQLSFRSNSRRKRIKVVLDGQQRLQSLYVALCGTYEDKDLYLDLLSGRESDSSAQEKYLFRFMTTREAVEANKPPENSMGVEEKDDYLEYFAKVSDLYEMTQTVKINMFRKISASFDLPQKTADRAENNLFRFHQKFIESQNILQLYVIDENLPKRSADRKSETDVLEIFVRINTEGTDLSRSDLIFSMLKLNWRESAQLLPKFIKRIRKDNSFSLDMDFVIRCLFAVSDLGARFDIDLVRSKGNAETLKTNFERCCNAIEATIDFIIQECRCHSTNIIVSNNTIIPLVYYFYWLSGHKIRASQIQSVKTAFYLTAFAKAFTRHAESRLDGFINQILKPAVNGRRKSFPVSETMGFVVQKEKIRGYDDLLSQNRILGLHLIQGLTGTHFKYAPNAPEVDHIFPRSKLIKKGVDKNKIDHYANSWILAKGKNRNKSNEDPDHYFSEISQKVLKKALIDKKLLKYGRYEQFLRVRSGKMINTLKRILQIDPKDFRE